MRLKLIRETRNMSQYRLAKLSGVSPQHISNLESGQRKNAGGDILLKLSRALGCAVEDILEAKDENAGRPSS